MRGNFGTATVRYTADDGSSGTVRIVANARGVYVDGQPAEVVTAGLLIRRSSQARHPRRDPVRKLRFPA